MIPLIFKKLTIRKLPGMPGGIRAFDELADGINIIAGPNASGKSSTARLIRTMIWNSPPGPETDAEASFVTGADNWDVRLGPGIAELQRDGSPDELRGIPGKDASHRYMLAMHELVTEKEQSMAQHIARVSIGGYDLDQAAKELAYSSGFRNRRATEYTDLETAGKKRAEISRQQQILKRDEEVLGSKKQEYEIIRQAGDLTDFYEKLVRYLEAKNKLNTLQAVFDAFPASMAHVHNEDYTRVCELEEEIEKAEMAIRTARQEIRRCEDVLGSLGLPTSGVPARDIDAMRIHTEKLKDLEDDVDELVQRIETARAQAREALKGIAIGGPSEDWEGIELEDVHKLDEFLRQAQLITSRLHQVESRLAEMQSAIRECSKQDPAILNDGINLLRRWTKKEGPAGLSFRWFMITAIFIVGSPIAAVVLGWPGLALALPALFMAWKGYKAKGDDQAVQYRADYEKLDLPVPAAWNIQEVGITLEALEKEYESAKKREGLNSKIKDLSDEKTELQTQMGNIARQHADFAEELKVVPGLPEKHLESNSGMYHFLTRLKQWQVHHAEAAGHKAAMDLALSEAGEVLSKVNGLLKGYGLEPASDATTARVLQRELEQKAADFKEASERMARQRDIITEREEQAGRDRKRILDIYHRIGLEEGGKEILRKLLEQLDAYSEARADLDMAGRELASHKAALQGQPLYNKQREDSERLSLEEARRLVSQNKDLYARLEESNSAIATIEAQIGQARRGQDLEKALAEEEKSLEALTGLFEKNLAGCTGQLIVDQLKKESRDRSRPKVFHKANELFNQITLGRYELRLDESGDTAFRAYDTLFRRGQGLDELSTGTRIQLLLAVRLAFVETQEEHLRLPLLADELLANCDDIRARAIIDAMIGISKAGRQVFYFTAQHDEVGKWKAVLKAQEEVDYRVTYLEGEDHTESRFSPAGEGWTDLGFDHEVPEPGGLSHGEYGKKLKVPGFDPVHDDSARLHLWYLQEDTQVLHQCLLAGIRRWGQLESFIAHNGKVPGLTGDVLAPMREKARLLERFCELYRKGRPRRIDAGTLLESGAVSDKFMNPVRKLLDSLDRNPLRLIDELKAGRVPRFQAAKAEELRIYLEEQNIIDGLDPLDPDEVLLSLQAFLSGLDLDRRQAGEFIRRVLNRT